MSKRLEIVNIDTHRYSVHDVFPTLKVGFELFLLPRFDLSLWGNIDNILTMSCQRWN